ncbi:MAG: hypothetical protein ACI4LD_02965 [Lentihominibacter sp.]
MIHKNKLKKITALAVAALLLCSVFVPAVSWADSTEQKEEVVYGNLSCDGTPQKVYVVNIFDENRSGRLSDYGDYTELLNMSSTDEIKTEGDKIYVDTDEAPFYYEGVMDDPQLPWKVNIGYRLDGARCEPEKLAGKSGALEISIKIIQNRSCDSVFYENYALQISLTLDGNFCRNIRAENATTANAGSDRQITFTILPGKGADLKVTADVTDFEMDEITLNGVMLNMDVDVDDSELMEEADRLINGVEELDDGAGEIKEGTADLSSGASDVSEGAADVDKGAASLSSGAEQLSSGADELSRGAASVSSGSRELLAAVQKLLGNVSSSAYKDIMKSQGLDIDGLKAGNDQAIQQLEVMISQMEGQLPQEQIQSLKQIGSLLQGSNANIAGIEAYLSSINDSIAQLEKGTENLCEGAQALTEGTEGLAEGAAGISQGSSSLAAGASELSEGSSALAEGAEDLDAGAGELKDGTSEFRDETSDIDTRISEKIDDIKSEISGDSSKVKSFVSDKNTNIESVQFALRTEAIREAETEEQPQETADDRNILQKLLDLFR